MEKHRGQGRVSRRDGELHEVRLPEDLFLSRPDLWTRQGLEDYLREHGIDPSRPYHREEIFVQLDTIP